MPNTVPILQLEDEDNGDFYPVTSTEAVFDPDGNSIETRLTDIITPAQWAQLQQIFS